MALFKLTIAVIAVFMICQDSVAQTDVADSVFSEKQGQGLNELIGTNTQGPKNWLKTNPKNAPITQQLKRQKRDTVTILDRALLELFPALKRISVETRKSLVKVIAPGFVKYFGENFQRYLGQHLEVNVFDLE